MTIIMINWSKIKGWHLILSLLAIITGINIILSKGVSKSIFIPLGDYAIPIGGTSIVFGIYILYLAFTQK